MTVESVSTCRQRQVHMEMHNHTDSENSEPIFALPLILQDLEPKEQIFRLLNKVLF